MDRQSHSPATSSITERGSQTYHNRVGAYGYTPEAKRGRYVALRFKLLLALAILLMLAGIGVSLLTPVQMGQAQDDLTMTPSPTPDLSLVDLNADSIKRATVFIMQTYESRGEPVISCVGSGTLISEDGLILTNAHVALPSETCRSDTLVISVTTRLDEPPIPTYTAEVVDSSRGLDLAVLRITGYMDGRVIEPGSLQLPFVELGDSSALGLDDTITVMGYPQFGDEPVTATRGTIRGLTAEARAGDRAWLRTGAVIPGTMSGGGAYDRDGKLIGIPTTAPGTSSECRVIQDTNGDGRADDNDHCVPVGGFITAIRPSRLARGLFRAATLGVQQGENSTPAFSAVLAGPATFTNLFFTTRINEAGVPTNVVGSVPAGIESLYLFFDYDNMVDGMVYELRVTVDDVPDATYSLPPVTWSGGERGTWYIGSANTPWRNGRYDFRLFIESREVGSASINVGIGPSADPYFSDIVFGLLDTAGSLVGTNYVLPEGSAVQARFNYHNMTPETQWAYIWYFDGVELPGSRQSETWLAERGEQGTHMITVTADFLPGSYRLELYINNALSARADFVVAGGAEINNAVIFSDFRFTTEQLDGIPTGPIRTEFAEGIEQLVVFFNWRLLAPGTMWTRRWTIDGEVVFEVTEPWADSDTGEDFFLSLDSLDTLPDATYGVEISIANVTQAAVSAKVGLGQLRAETFQSAAGIIMAGRITDAETGIGIPGAMFIVLDAEYSIEDFFWDQSMVAGVSVADSEGYFRVPDLLERGTYDSPILYSILVRAAGYYPLSADGIIVVDDTASPVEINVEMTPQ
ncbi:MAG: trypsin-like peptidase domain-containing protein [Anaerolineae bacterium]|nr:trypsin-like peptidase domain-containing protein [Anaerolineae bacterium]